MAIGDSTVFFVQPGGQWIQPTGQQNTFANVSAAIAASEVVAPSRLHSLADDALKPKKTKKRPVEKDTLSRRSNLAIGKEGSRRRQRWDNNNFSENPVAVLYSEDLRPPGYSRSKNIFQWNNIAINEEEPESVEEENQHVPIRSIVPLSRSVRKDLKRAHLPLGLVSSYEDQLMRFIATQQRRPPGEVDAQDLCLVWEISDRFVRWFVHAMCDYYNLESFSETISSGRRITYICHKAHLASVTTGEECSIEVDWKVPQMLFVDYLRTR
ncbi:hypothetical protein J3Q64DRAFT_1840313 [Phycomyces blakesleeanus]|uniref:Uncharacterized protein n=2 Tax=Phycomyces blakesleeanus TaxID=4837 RepID=A0A162TR89_PHYB8|nr:hypothetical protein PHYBLDRAFT_148348 [Phycomyces blakesleeanus NRRL 1555(-)]OAD70432.1 hypothetical protein PHYBLDRAFT_148348 [Phycomyces blakesleeanus NRRL 1555(-)]|eukprot:XP_018288472.1 hypothetical protein PHYBLDRAFT_148348 [Phycomyces blakesleeanus NRRL 1555(-)]